MASWDHNDLKNKTIKHAFLPDAQAQVGAAQGAALANVGAMIPVRTPHGDEFLPNGLSPESTRAMLRAIGMRLHLREGEWIPLDFITAHKLRDKDEAIVFIVHNAEPVIIRDEWPLFPSDRLITQIRLMLGGKVSNG